MNFCKENDDIAELLVPTASDKRNIAKCLLGKRPNCTIEQLLQEEELQEFLEKRERGELLVQKTTRLFENFLAPIQLSAPATYLAFDHAIQLIACDMPNIHSNDTMNVPLLALSVVVNEPHINRCQEIDQYCDVTCAPSPKPTVRNAFIIRKPQQHQRQQRTKECNDNDVINANKTSNCQYLRYGEEFMLECYESKQRPLMIYSSPKNPFIDNYSNCAMFKSDHGELKQSVGLALQKANFNSGETSDDRHFAQSIPSSFFHWRFLHVNPDVRYETIGENIPINAKVIVQHGFSRNNLCCEKALLSTIFGMECGVSCHTEKTKYGTEAASNVWQISTKSSEF